MRFSKLLLLVAFFSFVISFYLFFFLFNPVLAACDVRDYSTLEDYQRAIEECQQEISSRMGAHTKNKEDLTKLQKSLENTKKLISSAEVQINNLEKEIFDREVKLEYQKEILAASVRSHYKRSRRYSPFLLFLASTNAADLLRELSYRQTAANEDKQTIVNISQDLKALIEDKEKTEKNKDWLTRARNSLNQQVQTLGAEVEEVEDYFTEVSGKIAQLSAKQQAILSEKQGTFQTTVGEVPLADDPASRPDYNPGFSPAFAAFSFGAPHFKGMSQYGAFGRAKSGQSAEEILRAYYGGGIEIKKDYSTGIMINVEGYGAVDIETYTHRIYEVPNSWGDQGGMEALKAQAVAARSYALARTNNGAGSICATESCQVYKPANKGGNWEGAVNETRGWVLMANGQPFSTWYASTSGGYQESYSFNGYSTPAFWDTPSGRSGWTDQAWEKQAGSPWFYKAWYKTRSGDSCGRSHPWLTAEEIADVLNAWVVLIKHGESDDRVLPLGGCWGGNPYSLTDLKNRAEQLSTGYSKVTGVSVTYSEGGYTSNVNFETDQGGVSLSGADFKKAFNLRAPARIALKSGLFNLEKK